MTEIPPAPSPVNGEEDSAEGHLMRGRGADAERAEGDDDSAEGHVFRPSAKPPT